MSSNEHEIGFTPAARFLLVAGAFVLVVAGMQAAKDLVAPFLMAVFIAVIAVPPLRFLHHRGLPRWAAMLIVIGGLISTGMLIAALVSGSLDAFTTNLPEYQVRLSQLTDDLVQWLNHFGIRGPGEAVGTFIDPAKAMGVAGKLISGMGGVLTNALLIMLTVVFILLETVSLPAKLHAAGLSKTGIDRLHHVVDNINHYMALKAMTSIATAIAVWLVLQFTAVDFAVLWALIAFLLNFVPTIGSIIAAIPAVLLALVQHDLQTALAVTVGYVLINTVIGNWIEPRIMGRGLGLSTLVVFVSLVFWGWVLGAVGMFLSVPLTMALKIALDCTPQTRPLAILLGPEVNPEPVAAASAVADTES